MKTILFACVHNAGRSQMAAALFNRWSDSAKARAISAGTEPGDRVHPEVVDTMKELGIDLSAARPQKLTEGLAGTVDMLVTMGCGETCPVVPETERADWPLADPKGQSLMEVRAIRDEIEQRVRSLLAAKGWGGSAQRGNGDEQSRPAAQRPVRPALTIEPATRDDERAVRALLVDAGLPLEGLEIGFPSGYAIARRGGVMVGCAGLETYDREGLLRSVAVGGSERGNGIGAMLVADRLSAAKRAGLGAVYLLTTTAPEFFRRLGFESCERGTVPRAVQSSAEFAEICPSTAACMRRAVK